MYQLITDFLKVHLLDLLIIFCIVATLLYLYKNGKKDLVKKIILSLVVQAEKQLGSSTGNLKYAFVVERAYNVLPVALKWLITKKEIDHLIEESVIYLKNYLVMDNKNLLGHGEENKTIHIQNITVKNEDYQKIEEKIKETIKNVKYTAGA